MQLIAAHSRHGTLWGPYLSRKVREGGKVIPDKGTIISKLAAGQLHTIPAIPRELYHYIFNDLNRYGHKIKMAAKVGFLDEVKVQYTSI